ncbi:hypothetical protein MTR67_052041 [Solanum verrucosum]|uniref:Uncharacterized protein n=1 Tax=Solanum verrucosum TaxID=315347 RepID=A0AAF0V8F0_SOLVR|nr:hypothetical protein MTR67_052041 [Solanum verrucosum]
MNFPSKGSPSRATSRLVVKTTDRGKARGVALASWGLVKLGEVTGQGTTGTTTSCGALDGVPKEEEEEDEVEGRA